MLYTTLNNIMFNNNNNNNCFYKIQLKTGHIHAWATRHYFWVDNCGGYVIMEFFRIQF